MFLLKNPQDLMKLLEPLNELRWITNTIRCRRHSVRGVPLKQLDVLWDDVEDGSTTDLIEVGHRPGRHDGCLIPRICIQRYSDRWTEQATFVGVALDRLRVIELWSDSGQKLWEWHGFAVENEATDIRPVVFWHYARYYKMLPREDVEALAEALSVGYTPVILNNANRLASRALYRLARDLGWRKLSVREKKRLNITQDWCRADLVQGQHGIGQYTLDAARGKSIIAV